MHKLGILLSALLFGALPPAAHAQTMGPSEPGVLKVGFIPAEDSRAMVRQSQAVMDRLGAATGLKVEAFVGSDYNATIEALRSNKIEVALLGPFSYVLATTQAPVEAFAVTVTAKTMSPSYHSIIIAKKDSGLTSLDSLKGHTFAFVDPGSTSGSLMPSAAMREKNIVPEKDLKKVMYSGGHDASIIAVAEGKVEAASVADRIFAGACDKKLVDCDKIKIIWTSEAIPNDPVLYRKNLPEDLKKKIREAFYGIQNLTFGEMGTVARFDPATDADYNIIRKIATILNLDLTKVK
ncbi:MAG TPA: phosphate/phosphite/phosphonate ABC transporter substrate-binding protein [Casimicrobiaceae bacterium]|jgi:phosphonate transport system substrate-binding protein|nr:phosphate/phosphite/phosphonate ABC transporter substrate-binding protein [Casimicrobiaceae bacterium]